jgi:hypothetical protein
MAVANDPAFRYAVVTVGSDGSLLYVGHAIARDGARTVLDQFTLH